MQAFRGDLACLRKGVQTILWTAEAHALSRGYRLEDAAACEDTENIFCDGCCTSVFECYYAKGATVLCRECVDVKRLPVKDKVVNWDGELLVAHRTAYLAELQEALKQVSPLSGSDAAALQHVPLLGGGGTGWRTVDAGPGGEIWAVTRETYDAAFREGDEQDLFAMARINWHHQKGVPYIIIGHDKGFNKSLWTPDTFFETVGKSLEVAGESSEVAAPLLYQETDKTVSGLIGDFSPHDEEVGPMSPYEGKWDLAVLPVRAAGTTPVRAAGTLPNKPAINMDWKELHKKYNQNGEEGFGMTNFPADGTLEMKMPGHYADAMRGFANAVDLDLISRANYPVEPDASPKLYINAGHTETFFHLDVMGGAVNSLKSGGGMAKCTTWTVAPSMPPWVLETMLRSAFDYVARERNEPGLSADWTVHDHNVFLEEEHVQYLLDTFGVRMWVFAQRAGYDVVIPALCGHQVDNPLSAIKVAVDTLRADEIEACMVLSADRRAQARKQLDLNKSNKKKRKHPESAFNMYTYLGDKVQLHRTVCTSFLNIFKNSAS